MHVILAAIVGLVVGGASGSLIVGIKGPVFHWEMAGMFISFLSALVGGVSAGLSAKIAGRSQVTDSGKVLVGLFVGAGLGFIVGLWLAANSSITNPKAPQGIAYWSVATIVASGGLSGMVGSLLARIGKTG